MATARKLLDLSRRRAPGQRGRDRPCGRGCSSSIPSSGSTESTRMPPPRSRRCSPTCGRCSALCSVLGGEEQHGAPLRDRETPEARDTGGDADQGREIAAEPTRRAATPRPAGWPGWPARGTPLQGRCCPPGPVTPPTWRYGRAKNRAQQGQFRSYSWTHRSGAARSGARSHSRPAARWRRRPSRAAIMSAVAASRSAGSSGRPRATATDCCLRSRPSTGGSILVSGEAATDCRSAARRPRPRRARCDRPDSRDLCCCPGRWRPARRGCRRG